MKVILQQDVAKVGRKFDIAEVSDGFAMNQLIPKGLAKAATPDNLKALSVDAEKASGIREEASQKFHNVADKLEDVALIVKAEVNEQGHLFAALKADAIVESAANMGLEITTKMIEMPTHIKEVGEYEVLLVDGSDKKTFVVKVEAK